MDLFIRQIKENDINELIELFYESDLMSDIRSELSSLIKCSNGNTSESNMWILTDDSNYIYGACGYYKDPIDPDDVYWLNHFVVRPEYRNKGYGVRLLTFVQIEIEKLKGITFCLWSSSTHLNAKKNAIHIYHKFGFKECGRIKDFWYTGIDKIFMVKKLGKHK